MRGGLRGHACRHCTPPTPDAHPAHGVPDESTSAAMRMRPTLRFGLRISSDPSALLTQAIQLSESEAKHVGVLLSTLTQRVAESGPAEARQATIRCGRLFSTQQLSCANKSIQVAERGECRPSAPRIRARFGRGRDERISSRRRAGRTRRRSPGRAYRARCTARPGRSPGARIPVRPASDWHPIYCPASGSTGSH